MNTKKKYEGITVGCVDTTVCFLQATMVFFPPTGEPLLMAVCLPEDSGVVVFFESWASRKDGGGPLSIHHLISEHEQIRVSLCGCPSVCIDAIIAHFCLDAGFVPPLWC